DRGLPSASHGDDVIAELFRILLCHLEHPFGEGKSSHIRCQPKLGQTRVHVKNLYNLYVYFWRWATWKVFENPPAKGVVAFITASSYLRGPGFAGMRSHMRQEFDELFVLDLGGDGIGARKSENVFDIQTPVAIGIGIRTGEPQESLPAAVRYARIDGTREEKYAALLEIEGLGSIEWQTCLEGWEDPMLPLSDGGARYREWPKLTDLFPWQHSGMQYKRTWPISAEKSALERRWESLVSSSAEDRAVLFRESRDRKIARKYPTLDGSQTTTPVFELDEGSAAPRIAEILYRSFDRQHAFADNRLGDYLRPPLWRSHGPRQLYMTSLLTKPLGSGPAAVATHLIPDLDAFCGRGAKDVIPLWRDKLARDPNVAAGVLEQLEKCLAMTIGPEELFLYTYAILQAPSFTARFVEELELPGPHIPITADPRLFSEVLEAGRKLMWIHTFGERFVPSGKKAGEVGQGIARSIAGIGSTAEDFPEDFSYEESSGEILVGQGRFGPVSAEVWNFEVSGFKVIRSWLGYRMKKGAGRKSSPLDELRPTIWPESFSNELLELIWTLEGTVEMSDELDRLLVAVVGGETISASEFPTPSDSERKPPNAAHDESE
ncbi:MAG: DNA methyltransferase, partial [Solirubrobacterales bacterium]|nr:DNA methyltransferase [Solirubrobacterales bacterium]